MGKHTPGPYLKDEGLADSIDNMRDCLKRGEGTKEEWEAIGVGDKDGYAESIAYCHPNNANILSASWDMLEALKMLCREDVQECEILWGQAVIDAKAIIKKAKGE